MRALLSTISACIQRELCATLRLSYNKPRAGYVTLGLALTLSLYGCGHKGPLIAPERADANSLETEVIEDSQAQPNTLQLPETHSH